MLHQIGDLTIIILNQVETGKRPSQRPAENPLIVDFGSDHWKKIAHRI